MCLYGRLSKDSKYVSHPVLELFSGEVALRPVPMYTVSLGMRKVGLTSRVLAKRIGYLLSEIDFSEKTSSQGSFDIHEEFFDASFRERHGLLCRKEALCAIHQPASFAQLNQARHRLAFEELFFFFIRLLYRLEDVSRVVSEKKDKGVCF